MRLKALSKSRREKLSEKISFLIEFFTNPVEQLDFN